MSLDWFLDGVAASRQREDLVDGFKAWVRLYYAEFSDATLVEPEYVAAWQTIASGPGFDPMDGAEISELIAEVQTAITSETGRTFDPIPD